MSTDVLVIFGAALLLAAAGTPVMRRVAFRIGIVDHTAERKLHTRSMPLLGGVALYAAVLGSLLLYPGQQALVSSRGSSSAPPGSRSADSGTMAGGCAPR